MSSKSKRKDVLELLLYDILSNVLTDIKFRRISEIPYSKLDQILKNIKTKDLRNSLKSRIEEVVK